ncbi:unnamed protein product [Caenorhabditis nigoni]
MNLASGLMRQGQDYCLGVKTGVLKVEESKDVEAAVAEDGEDQDEVEDRKVERIRILLKYVERKSGGNTILKLRSVANDMHGERLVFIEEMRRNLEKERKVKKEDKEHKMKENRSLQDLKKKKESEDSDSDFDSSSNEENDDCGSTEMDTTLSESEEEEQLKKRGKLEERNYEVAWTILDENFEKPARPLLALERKFNRIKIDQKNFQKMREDTSKLNAIITDMQNRGINVEAPSVYDRYIAKFPDEMAERLTAKTMSESFKGEFSKFQKWTMKILSRKVIKEDQKSTTHESTTRLKKRMKKEDRKQENLTMESIQPGTMDFGSKMDQDRLKPHAELNREKLIKVLLPQNKAPKGEKEPA